MARLEHLHKVETEYREQIASLDGLLNRLVDVISEDEELKAIDGQLKARRRQIQLAIDKLARSISEVTAIAPELSSGGSYSTHVERWRMLKFIGRKACTHSACASPAMEGPKLCEFHLELLCRVRFSNLLKKHLPEHFTDTAA